MKIGGVGWGWGTAGRHTVESKRWSTAALEVVGDIVTSMGLSEHTHAPFRALSEKVVQGAVSQEPLQSTLPRAP